MMYACSVSTKRSFVVAVVALAVVMSGQDAHAHPGWVLSHQKISSTQGGFTGVPDDGDSFCVSASLGGLDGDGVGDLAVGAYTDDDGGTNRGAVWELFLDGVPQTPCPWDIDGNGSVGASDLLSLLVSWGPCKSCPADFDGNGNVGASDLLALLVNWGPCP